MTTDADWTRLAALIDESASASRQHPDTDAGRALHDLAALQRIAAALQEQTDRAIVRARAQGATWTHMGWAGSRQAAAMRHAAALNRLTVEEIAAARAPAGDLVAC